MAELSACWEGTHMKQGDIVMVDLEPTRGREQRGYRPVLIISSDDFNRVTGVPVILPITTGGQFAGRIDFAVTLDGTRTTGVIRCDQPRVVDLHDRIARFVEYVPEDILLRTLAKVATIFE